MKKGLVVVLSVLAVFSLGLMTIHCEGSPPCLVNADCGEGEWCSGETNVCEACSCGTRQCGTDPCGVSCGTCGAGKFCNEFNWTCDEDCDPQCDIGQVCISGTCETGCAADGWCPDNYACDLSGGFPGDCVPDCSGLNDGEGCADGEDCFINTEGEPECGSACDPACETGFKCVAGECVEICCDDTPLNAYIEGTIISFPPSPVTPLEIQLAAVDAMSALTNPDPPHLTETMSNAMGAYRTDCMDLTNVSLAVMMLADDAGFDGTAGNFFPTYSGVLSIESNEDKVCVPEAPTAFGMPNTLVTMLAQVPALADIATDGFAVVLVTDDQQDPVDGAVLKKEDDTDLPVVIYPSATFDAFDGTETSANGVALVPGPLSLTNVKAVKTGMNWEAGPLAIVPGYCLTRPLLADAP